MPFHKQSLLWFSSTSWIWIVFKVLRDSFPLLISPVMWYYTAAYFFLGKNSGVSLIGLATTPASFDVQLQPVFLHHILSTKSSYTRILVCHSLDWWQLLLLLVCVSECFVPFLITCASIIFQAGGKRMMCITISSPSSPIFKVAIL